MTVKKTYVDALVRLVTALNSKDIDYDVFYHESYNGFVVTFKGGWDVAIHDSTAGSEIGLFESYGHVEDNGGVTPYMSVESIMKRFSLFFYDIPLGPI